MLQEWPPHWDRPPHQLYGVKHVAAVLGVRPQDVYGLIAAGKLFSVKVLSRRLVPDVELDRYLAERER